MNIYVTPFPDMTIVDPDLHDYLPPEGREVVDSAYWQRLADPARGQSVTITLPEGAAS
jgi:hypothetical protein